MFCEQHRETSVLRDNRRHFGSSSTFESARSSFPVDHAIVQQPPAAMSEVFPAEHSAVFDFSLCLWLHLAVDVSESTAFLVQVDQGVDLDDGVLDQSQRSGQVLVLCCSH